MKASIQELVLWILQNFSKVFRFKQQLKLEFKKQTQNRAGEVKASIQELVVWNLQKVKDQIKPASKFY